MGESPVSLYQFQFILNRDDTESLQLVKSSGNEDLNELRHKNISNVYVDLKKYRGKE